MINQRVDAPEGRTAALVFLVEPPVMIHYKSWTRATYEGVLAAVGFRTIVWERLPPSLDAEAQYGREFSEDCLRNPQSHLLHCEQ